MRTECLPGFLTFGLWEAFARDPEFRKGLGLCRLRYLIFPRNNLEILHPKTKRR